MPYIKRDANNQIVALLHHSAPEAEEFLAPTHPDIIQFLDSDQEQNTLKKTLAESDRDIARVTEDLIQLLIGKNIILFTDLPDAVQNKLLAREKMRSHLNDDTIDNFLDDSELL